MDIDPADVSLLRVVGVLLNRIGRPEEAIAFGNYLLQRDPSCAVCIMSLAGAYQKDGKYEDAARVIENLLSWQTPAEGFYAWIGDNGRYAGAADKALLAYQKELSDNGRESGIIMALHDLGRLDEFESRFDRFRTDADTRDIAKIYIWTEHDDKAFVWIDKVIAETGPEILRQFLGSGLTSKIESDPRWHALLNRYGYIEQSADEIEFQFILPPGVSVE